MKKTIVLLAVMLLGVAMLAGCGGGNDGGQATPTPDATTTPSQIATELTVVCTGINAMGEIEKQYGKFGDTYNSIPFDIYGAPDGTVCYAVILDDPDAKATGGKVWDHWLLANLKETTLPAGASKNNSGLLQGQNSWGSTGYRGPEPPDKQHTYYLRVYALDAELDLNEGFSRADLEAAMEGHILQEAYVTGAYYSDESDFLS